MQNTRSEIINILLFIQTKKTIKNPSKQIKILINVSLKIFSEKIIHQNTLNPQQVTATSKFNDLDPALECLFYKNSHVVHHAPGKKYFINCWFSVINQFSPDVNKNRNLQ